MEGPPVVNVNELVPPMDVPSRALRPPSTGMCSEDPRAGRCRSRRPSCARRPSALCPALRSRR